VFATAILPALRKRYPEARITWVVETESKEMVAHNPRLDRVIVLPRSDWKRALKRGRLITALKGLRSFLRELRSERYDLALDIQGILRSGLVAWGSGARRRIGLGSAEGSGLFMHQVVPSTGHPHERKLSSQYLHFAEVLGLEPGDFPMDVVPAATVEQSAREKLAAEGLAEGGFLTFVPFTTRPQKHWFSERWAALADLAESQLGLPIVIMGGPDDQVAMEEIQAATSVPLYNLVGRTSLGEAAAIMKYSAAAVGVDTGLTHLSIAFGRPTVTLFGSTLPYLDPPNSVTRILHEPMACSPCRKSPTCGGEWSCMRALDVPRVMAALAEVCAGPQEGR